MTKKINKLKELLKYEKLLKLVKIHRSYIYKFKNMNMTKKP